MHDIGWSYSHFTLTLRPMEAASLGAGLGCHLHGSYFWLFSSPKDNDRPCSKSVIERTKMKRNLTKSRENFLLSFLIVQIILYQQHKEVVVIWILALPFIICVCPWEFLTVSQTLFLDP